MLSRLMTLMPKTKVGTQTTSRLLSTFTNTKVKNLTDLFTELDVKPVSTDIFDNKSHAKTIDISLSAPVDPKLLPYAQVYTQEKLSIDQLTRINHSIIVARGDTRSPETLLELGGFHPQAVNPHSSVKFGEDILDVISHRDLAWGSGLVSFTSSITVAMNIPGAKYVYLGKMIGAIPPHPTFRPTEKEFSLPGGLDFEDIIAFRKLTSSSFQHSPIFISNEFKLKYPDKIRPVVIAYLRSDESCIVNDEVIQPENTTGFTSKNYRAASIDKIVFFVNLPEKTKVANDETNTPIHTPTLTNK